MGLSICRSQDFTINLAFFTPELNCLVSCGLKIEGFQSAHLVQLVPVRGPVHPEALTEERKAVPPSFPFGRCRGGVGLDQGFRFLVGQP